jgi:putative iron-regulated protein
MNLNKIFSILFTIGILSVLSCKKTVVEDVDTSTLRSEILNDIAKNVCKKSYENLYTDALNLENSIVELKQNSNALNLETAKSKWLKLRETWEQTEAWLFGPVSTANIDPRIDTWPVDFVSIDSVLNSGNSFTENYIDNLEDALKGFHPIEYFLWGKQGNKTAIDFTNKELEFLEALSKNLTKLCLEVKNSWDGNYENELKNAGISSSIYSSKKTAFLEITNAMAGICNEVAGGKIEIPFSLQNPDLEESPFSKNSLTDFKQNIIGVLKIYQGNLIEDKLGIEDLVKEYNISLHQKIINQHNLAISALNNINLPFGEAIIQQPILVQKAIDEINNLEKVINQDLNTFIQQYGND